MSKLHKFLETHGSVVKETESGSMYYLIGNKTVRVSDHLASVNIADTLGILLPQNSKKYYVVIFLGAIYVHISYTSLRVFLEAWVLISKGYAKRSRIGANELKNLRSKLATAQKSLNTLKDSASKLETTVTIEGLPVFTKGQQKSILGFVKQNKLDAKKK